MKFVPIICLALIFATPASAAPQWIYDYCRAQAFRADPRFTGAKWKPMLPTA